MKIVKIAGALVAGILMFANAQAFANDACPDPSDLIEKLNRISDFKNFVLEKGTQLTLVQGKKFQIAAIENEEGKNAVLVFPITADSFGPIDISLSYKLKVLQRANARKKDLAKMLGKEVCGFAQIAKDGKGISFLYLTPAS